MHALLSVVLSLFFLQDAPVPAAQMDVASPQPVAVMALQDGLDFLLLCDDPAVQTQVIGFADFGSFSVIEAMHTVNNAMASSFSWIAAYTFPSSIFAHSPVKARMHAEELE